MTSSIENEILALESDIGGIDQALPDRYMYEWSTSHFSRFR